jgi:hypothetical protein
MMTRAKPWVRWDPETCRSTGVIEDSWAPFRTSDGVARPGPVDNDGPRNPIGQGPSTAVE